MTPPVFRAAHHLRTSGSCSWVPHEERRQTAAGGDLRVFGSNLTRHTLDQIPRDELKDGMHFVSFSADAVAREDGMLRHEADPIETLSGLSVVITRGEGRATAPEARR